MQDGAGPSGAVLWLSRAQQSVVARTVPVSQFGLAAARPLTGGWRERLREWADDVELVPDLAENIGSVTWFRGAATCAALCFVAISLRPDLRPVPAIPEAPMSAASYDEVRSQMITPLALGADSGRHMGPTDRVRPLAETPERPMIELSAMVGAGDGFSRALMRAGVSDADRARVMDLIGPDVQPGMLRPGTRLDIVLGRRPNRNMARPLDALKFRARLELAIDVARVDGALSAKRIPIAVDNTPLRIQGVVSDGVYLAARAAGATPGTIQSYLRVIGQQMPITRIRPGDRFDIIVAHRRAETGETETGELIYGGIRQASGKKLDMLKWTHGGKTEWFEASGVGQKRPGLAKPVAAARLSSGFGMRFHPILGYSRMHAGTDFAARSGTPIYAVTDGVVAFAGRHGGHGNYVRLSHSGGIATGYAHMSRFAVSSGQRVRRGQVIGYVGSTGLSTGPHLHYEVYRRGRTVNPMSVKFEEQPLLNGGELAAFRARLAQLKTITNSPAMAAKSAPADGASSAEAKDDGAARPTKIASR